MLVVAGRSLAVVAASVAAAAAAAASAGNCALRDETRGDECATMVTAVAAACEASEPRKRASKQAMRPRAVGERENDSHAARARSCSRSCSRAAACARRSSPKRSSSSPSSARSLACSLAHAAVAAAASGRARPPPSRPPRPSESSAVVATTRAPIFTQRKRAAPTLARRRNHGDERAIFDVDNQQLADSSDFLDQDSGDCGHQRQTKIGM